MRFWLRSNFKAGQDEDLNFLAFLGSLIYRLARGSCQNLIAELFLQ
jgi:hypothetical protein